MTKKFAAELFDIATNEEFTPRQRKELLLIALTEAERTVNSKRRIRPPSR
jgi:hypothetical protein